jgi:hypothetical protein
MKSFVRFSDFLKQASRKLVAGQPARRIAQTLFILYPITVLFIAVFLFPRWSQAGQIRKIAISPEKPATINLAFGNATAISFPTKPETLVPGSPQKVDIHFLGKDITVTPLMSNPGNLILYTGGKRYVLIFRIVSEILHDDAVEITNAADRNTRTIRLGEDSYHVETVKLRLQKKEKRKTIETTGSASAIVFENRLGGAELSDTLFNVKGLRCEKCAMRTESSERWLVCAKPMPTPIRCRSNEFTTIELKRENAL